jgi:isoamylase
MSAQSNCRGSEWSDSHLGYRIGHRLEDLSFDRRDSAPGMLRSMMIDPAFTWGTDRPPHTPWHQGVIYELHVKGFTVLHPHVPAPLQGTYAGLATAPVIDHLLGVTAIELMPVHYFIDDVT